MAKDKSGKRLSGWVTFTGILFLIAGSFNLIWGLAAVGVSLGGSDATVIGDLSSNDLEGIGIAGLCVGALQLLAGTGILVRADPARILGLVLASLAVLLNFTYHRVLDGWAFTGLVLNLAIIYILAVHSREFR